MLHRDELFSPTQLEAAITEGLVRARRHPEWPLTILNYTEKAQYTDTWDEVTVNCRGLIVADDGLIVARPWPKFFNYTPDAGLDPGAPVEATDKMDGSLGILYPHDGQFAVSSRGSFDSEQARHATAVYRDRYAGWVPDPDLTYLFEIVYPGNRIVVDYGDIDDLFLLGATRIDGTSVPLAELQWPGPRTELMPAGTVGEVLALPPRDGAEGIVLTLTGTGQKWKIKQDDYVRLHRIITGTSELSVWRHLSDGGSIEQLVENTPDEFHTWIRDVIDDLTRRHRRIIADAEGAHRELIVAVGADAPRKDFAIAAKKHPHPHLLFALADGSTDKLDAAVWKMIRPDGSGAMSPWAQEG